MGGRAREAGEQKQAVTEIGEGEIEKEQRRGGSREKGKERWADRKES